MLEDAYSSTPKRALLEGDWKYQVKERMSNITPGKDHLREVLIHYLILKKNIADQTYGLLAETYGEHVPS
ncbi:hypothetical protein NPIL_445911 [Nephila pilipes]|uniref:Uncharacterized protein n=1 Tax=Nephila pilipes TaxID=299642 RepID=A0A8X6URP5_NEPPI|nr:hypothetical protein NPIL_445911 [Nephila pilipes]